MCFSAPASFIVGGTLVALATLTIAKSNKRSELPFACIPLLFGLQQSIEGVVWLTLTRPALNPFFAHLYLFFSHVLWPVFIPLAVLSLERNAVRRRWLYALLAVGVGVGVYLSVVIATNPVTCLIVNHNLDYELANPADMLSAFFYLVATIVSCSISSHKLVRIFGFVLMVLAAFAEQFSRITFVSLWCFTAAILSLIILVYFPPLVTRLSPALQLWLEEDQAPS